MFYLFNFWQVIEFRKWWKIPFNIGHIQMDSLLVESHSFLLLFSSQRMQAILTRVDIMFIYLRFISVTYRFCRFFEEYSTLYLSLTIQNIVCKFSTWIMRFFLANCSLVSLKHYTFKCTFWNLQIKRLHCCVSHATWNRQENVFSITWVSRKS